MIASVQISVANRASAGRQTFQAARHVGCRSLQHGRLHVVTVAAAEKDQDCCTALRNVVGGLAVVELTAACLAGPSLAAMLPGETSGGFGGLGGSKGLVELAKEAVPDKVARAANTNLGSAASNVKQTINQAANVAPDLTDAQDVASKAKRQASFSGDKAKSALQDIAKNVQSDTSELTLSPQTVANQVIPGTDGVNSTQAKKQVVGQALGKASALAESASRNTPALSDVAAAPTSTDNAAEQAATAGREAVGRAKVAVGREEDGKAGSFVSKAGEKVEAVLAAKAGKDAKKGSLGLPNLPQ